MNIAGPLDARVEARLLKGRADPDPIFARALALAAIRETFEETGLVVGLRDYGGPDRPPAVWRPYAAHDCLPDLQELHFIARAITPPFLPKRFDTRFFAADAGTVAAKRDGVSPFGSGTGGAGLGASRRGGQTRPARRDADGARRVARAARRRHEPVSADALFSAEPGQMAARPALSGKEGEQKKPLKKSGFHYFRLSGGLSAPYSNTRAQPEFVSLDASPSAAMRFRGNASRREWSGSHQSKGPQPPRRPPHGPPTAAVQSSS